VSTAAELRHEAGELDQTVMSPPLDKKKAQDFINMLKGRLPPLPHWDVAHASRSPGE
jgi:hypothetical protein